MGVGGSKHQVLTVPTHQQPISWFCTLVSSSMRRVSVIRELWHGDWALYDLPASRVQGSCLVHPVPQHTASCPYVVDAHYMTIEEMARAFTSWRDPTFPEPVFRAWLNGARPWGQCNAGDCQQAQMSTQEHPGPVPHGPATGPWARERRWEHKEWGIFSRFLGWVGTHLFFPGCRSVGSIWVNRIKDSLDFAVCNVHQFWAKLSGKRIFVLIS